MSFFHYAYFTLHLSLNIFWTENFFRRAEQKFYGYSIRLTHNTRICNARSGKVGSSHSYLNQRLLQEIDEMVYEYDKNILNNWYMLQYQE